MGSDPTAPGNRVMISRAISILLLLVFFGVLLLLGTTYSTIATSNRARLRRTETIIVENAKQHEQRAAEHKVQTKVLKKILQHLSKGED